jgi:hypothetical protein
MGSLGAQMSIMVNTTKVCMTDEERDQKKIMDAL